MESFALRLLIILIAACDFAITSNPGTCPGLNPGTIGTCAEQCSEDLDDSDCEAWEKCCSNGCGHLCMLASGGCPDTSNTAGTCVEECSADTGCPDSKICCSNGCGHTCQLKTCPGYTGASDADCMEECAADSDCADYETCCQNGCANVCQPAMCPVNDDDDDDDDVDDYSDEVLEECSDEFGCGVSETCCYDGNHHVCQSTAPSGRPKEWELLTSMLISSILSVMACR